MLCPDFTENVERPALSTVKVGDYVFLEQRFGVRLDHSLAKIGCIDPTGRLYICASQHYGVWRYGFNPNTGTAYYYKGQRMLALTEAEKRQAIERTERYQENVRRTAALEASEHGQLIARVQLLFSGGCSIREMAERIDVDSMRLIVKILDDNWKA